MVPKALRARLSRLSFAELLTEGIATLDHVKANQEQLSQMVELAERYDREEVSQALSQRQAEFARQPRLQPAILAAARHYRDLGMNAGQAWDAVAKTPFATGDGRVVVEGSKRSRLTQRLRVISRDGTQRKRPIGFSQWRQRYWPPAS